MPTPAHTIQDVITALDQIIRTCEEEGSRQAYFAVLYKAMTEAVRDAILAGHFEDGPRMEKLDVLFAQRYLDAWQHYRQGLPVTNSWKAAFEAAAGHNLIVLQHLILGINAHINLDLGIAAALTAPGDEITALQKDFEKINDIIAALADTMQAKLERICWPMRLIRRVMKSREKAVLDFSIGKAREGAWANASALAQIEGAAALAYIEAMDKAVSVIAHRVARPRTRISTLLLPFIQWWEPRETERIIELLKQPA
ncbi:MAG: hypothetical protein KDD19_20210 [Phaeodactylibacter sp.]|nr:hypothetical protein [Phaeodactylibacter sp.]MCB9049149.1 hypothetical protein [Lewinellaceae bacterium]